MPAESLQLHTDTVKAISKEVVRMLNDVHARFKKDPLSVTWSTNCFVGRSKV